MFLRRVRPFALALGVLAPALMTMSWPADARELTEAEASALEKAAGAYMRAVGRRDAEDIVAALPPRILSVFGAAAGIETKKLSKTLIQQTADLMQNTRFSDVAASNEISQAGDATLADGTAVNLPDGFLQRDAVARHQTSGDLEVFGFGGSAGLQDAADARRIDAEGLLHEDVDALLDGVLDMNRPEAGGRRQQHDAAGADSVNGLLVCIKTEELPLLGNIDLVLEDLVNVHKSIVVYVVDRGESCNERQTLLSVFSQFPDAVDCLGDRREIVYARSRARPTRIVCRSIRAVHAYLDDEHGSIYQSFCVFRQPGSVCGDAWRHAQPGSFLNDFH
jgi:hypothetical protein